MHHYRNPRQFEDYEQRYITSLTWLRPRHGTPRCWSEKLTSTSLFTSATRWEGFELGLIPDGKPGPGGTVAYWGVADAAAAVKRLQTLGATLREPVQDAGEGIRVAAVADLFGNTLGVIENPHFQWRKCSDAKITTWLTGLSRG